MAGIGLIYWVLGIDPRLLRWLQCLTDAVASGLLARRRKKTAAFRSGVDGRRPPWYVSLPAGDVSMIRHGGATAEFMSALGGIAGSR